MLKRLLIFLFIGASATACNTVKDIGTDVVDCTVSQIESEITQFEPIVQALIGKYTGMDGIVDWTSIDGILINLAVNDGMCVIADITGKTLQASSAVVPAPPIAPPTKVNFDQLRTNRGIKKTYKTKYGTI